MTPVPCGEMKKIDNSDLSTSFVRISKKSARSSLVSLAVQGIHNYLKRFSPLTDPQQSYAPSSVNMRGVVPPSGLNSEPSGEIEVLLYRIFQPSARVHPTCTGSVRKMDSHQIRRTSTHA